MATPGTAPDRSEQHNSQENRDENLPHSREFVIKVWLNEEGKVEVDRPYFFVSKSANEEVRWVCAQNHDHTKDQGLPCFSVEFAKDDTPFYEFQFNSDVPVSGLVRRDVLPSSKCYEYTVRIGEKSLDPGGGVKK
jgi:hypothetical protein